MTRPPDDDTAAAEGQPIAQYVSLSAQLRAIPPDETPGLLGVRELSDEEVAQYRRDAALLRSVAPLTPYARATDAVTELAELVDQLGDATGDATLSRRGQRRAQRALAIVARTLGDLPDGLEASLRDRFGSAGEEARRLSEEHARLAGLPSYRLAAAFDSAPVEHLRAVSGSGTSELVLIAEGVPDWPAAAEELPQPAPIGLVATAERALFESQQLAARWLLEHKDTVREASLRLAMLAAEVIEGAPAVVVIRIRRRGAGEEPEVLGMTPDPVPLEELHALQAALVRAERRLETEPREPALRGTQGLYPEQILAAFADTNPELLCDLAEDTPDPVDDDSDANKGAAEGGGGYEEGETEDDEDDEQPGAPPLDLATVIKHAELGTMALEQAWSRTLADENSEELLARWLSAVEAIRAAVFASDQRRPEEERYLELPLTDADIAAVELAPGSDRAAHQARLAQMLTLIDLIHAIRGLNQPTLRLVDEGRGHYAEWVSSGAFAAARDQLRILAELLNAETASPTADEDIERALHLAPQALLRGDPEAAVLHLARAPRLDPADPDDPDTGAVLELIKDAAVRLARGDQLDLAAVTLLAQTGAGYIGRDEEPADG